MRTREPLDKYKPLVRSVTRSILLIFLLACKKDAGIHCPPLEIVRAPHKVDLSPVAHLPEIMDTLAKYPQVHPKELQIAGYGLYTVTLHCDLYYQNVRVNNHSFRLFYPHPEHFSYSPPVSQFNVDTNPRISAAEAVSMTRERNGYDQCLMAELVIDPQGNGSTIDYRLVWFVYTVSNGQYIAGIDAHTGIMFNYLTYAQ
jgi:hypothetical protein